MINREMFFSNGRRLQVVVKSQKKHRGFKRVIWSRELPSDQMFYLIHYTDKPRPPTPDSERPELGVE